jgi:hypothetical protein
VERWGRCGIEAAPDRNNPKSAALLADLADLGDAVTVFTLADNAISANWCFPAVRQGAVTLPTTVFYNNGMEGNDVTPPWMMIQAAGCSLAIPPWAVTAAAKDGWTRAGILDRLREGGDLPEGTA